MCVNVTRRSGAGDMQQVAQKMVNYTLYEQSQETVREQQQAIVVLTQKIDHLDNLLKLKCLRFADLEARLARKSTRGPRPSDLLLQLPTTATTGRQPSPSTPESSRSVKF